MKNMNNILYEQQSNTLLADLISVFLFGMDEIEWWILNLELKYFYARIGTI